MINQTFNWEKLDNSGVLVGGEVYLQIMFQDEISVKSKQVIKEIDYMSDPKLNLQTLLDKDKLKGEFIVTVKSGHKLKAMDTGFTQSKKSDPYCVAYLRNNDEHIGKEQKTKVQKKNLNPVWNKEMRFPIDSFKAEQKDLMLILKCRDQDLMTHETIGKFDWPL